MNKTERITNQINTFDFFYEMSDSDKTYRDGRRNEQEIKTELSKLSNSELIEVKKGLTVDMDNVNRYFDLSTTEEPVNDSELKTDSTPLTVCKKSFKSELFTKAWELFRCESIETFSEALKLAWRRSKVLEALKSGIAYFSRPNTA